MAGIFLNGKLYAGGGAPSGGEGTSDYNELSNRPSINGIVLTDHTMLSDLGILESNSSLSAEQQGELLNLIPD